MRPSRGIKVTVFLFALVLVVFAAFTLFLPDLNDEISTANVNANGKVNVTDSQFSNWLNTTYTNLSVIVAQIQSSGMGMANTSVLDEQLKGMAESYKADLENMTVSANAEAAKAEFKAGLEDYAQAASSRINGGGMSKMGQSMEHFLRASIHIQKALQEMDDLS
jgi:hypothetical protein